MLNPIINLSSTISNLSHYNHLLKNGNNCSLILNDYCESIEDYVLRIKEFLRLSSFSWVLIILYVIVFIVGVVGNFLVCLIFLKNKHMRTVTNVFIVNLAFSDLMVLLLCLPLTLVEDILKTWFFGYITCKIVKYFQHISVIMSILTLSVISVERWYVICYPLKFNSSIQRACIAIISIWLSSILIGIPQVFSMSVIHYNKVPPDVHWLTECSSIWDTHLVLSVKMIEFIVLFILPLLWMATAYTMITEKLWCQQTIISDQNQNQSLRSKDRKSLQQGITNQLRSRRRVCIMLILMVIMFFICYLPIHLIQFVRLFVSQSFWDSRPVLAQYFNKGGILSHWLCYFNSAINPMIYMFMSTKIRSELKKICCHCNLRFLPNDSPSVEYHTTYLRVNKNINNNNNNSP